MSPIKGPSVADGRLEWLYEALRPRLAGLLRSLGTPEVDIADLIQDAFVVAVRLNSKVPVDDEGARRWLFAIAVRVQANWRRGTVRRERLAQRFHLEWRAHEGRFAVSLDERRAALEEWQALTTEEQRLLLMKGWHGFSSEELASRIGVTTRAAEMRLSRVRARLRTRLS